MFEAGCRKGHAFMSEAVIVGWNYGACATCGGFYLNISSDTSRDSTTYYVINYSVSLNAVISQYSLQYTKNRSPIYVFVDWQPARKTIPYAPVNWIYVTNIEAR